MPSTLARENAAALYLQISSLLHEEISRGLYDPSGKLPSEAELCKRFAVSRVTVRLALDRLAEENVVERKQGKGTFVAGKQLRHGLDTLRSFHESLRIQGLNPEMRLIVRHIVNTPDNVRSALGVNMEKSLLLERLHVVDGEPVALGRSYLPVEVDSLSWEETEQQPTYAILESLTGLRVVRADIGISAQSADKELADILKISSGMPLLVMRRLSYLANEDCCDHSVFYIRPQHYEFVMSSYFKPVANGNVTRG
ncbi:MAG TPA: GntR family transcriptional regulator [Methylovorus sp.]|nr:GntR family transcriptional regulator [Methylovorus sp.]